MITISPRASICVCVCARARAHAHAYNLHIMQLRNMYSYVKLLEFSLMTILAILMMT